MSEVAELFSSSYGKTVTPHDANDIGFVTRLVVIGVAGDIKVNWALNGSTETLVNVPAGSYPWRITRVWSAGTTADDISCFQ